MIDKEMVYFVYHLSPQIPNFMKFKDIMEIFYVALRGEISFRIRFKYDILK